MHQKKMENKKINKLKLVSQDVEFIPNNTRRDDLFYSESNNQNFQYQQKTHERDRVINNSTDKQDNILHQNNEHVNRFQPEFLDNSNSLNNHDHNDCEVKNNICITNNHFNDLSNQKELENLVQNLQLTQLNDEDENFKKFNKRPFKNLNTGKSEDIDMSLDNVRKEDSFSGPQIPIYSEIFDDVNNFSNTHQNSLVLIEEFKQCLITLKNNNFTDYNAEKLFINYISRKNFQFTIIKNFDKFDYFLIEVIKKILLNLGIQIFNRLDIFEFFMNFYLKVEEEMSISITYGLNFEQYCIQMNMENFIYYLSKLKTDNEKEYVLKIFTNISIIDVLILRSKNRNIYEYLIADFYAQDRLHKIAPLSIILENRFIKYSLSYFSTFVIQRYIERYQSLTVIQILNKSMSKFVTNKNGVFILITTFKTFDISTTKCMVDYIVDNCKKFFHEKYFSLLLEFVLTNFDYSFDLFLSKNDDILIGKFND
jgi:hypothetical protein